MCLLWHVGPDVSQMNKTTHAIGGRRAKERSRSVKGQIQRPQKQCDGSQSFTRATHSFCVSLWPWFSSAFSATKVDVQLIFLGPLQKENPLEKIIWSPPTIVWLRIASLNQKINFLPSYKRFWKWFWLMCGGITNEVNWTFFYDEKRIIKFNSDVMIIHNFAILLLAYII